eukprot:GHVU01235404.1.p3 GENE.GHVU01235404.1~~GHVU01235404.1.p3  ORF type:complete len:101 (-),score=15.95 GHVU01235404.1:304-606(-)
MHRHAARPHTHTHTRIYTYTHAYTVARRLLPHPGNFIRTRTQTRPTTIPCPQCDRTIIRTANAHEDQGGDLPRERERDAASAPARYVAYLVEEEEEEEKV